MKELYKVSHAILDLVKATQPQQSNHISDNISLAQLLPLIEGWRIGYQKRLEASLNDRFGPLKEQIMKVLSELGLFESIVPKYKEYNAVVILGSTGLSHYQIWQDLINLKQLEKIKMETIYLLGGDRKIHLVFDRLDLAYQRHPEHFKRLPALDEIKSCQNEMELMKLISSVLVLPDNFNNIPIISVAAQGKKLSDGSMIQADTKDTLVRLSEDHLFPNDATILFMSTLPYAVRQGLQAEMIMPDLKVDISAFTHPYLETIDTPLKGELPLSLYMDELYWLLYTKKQHESLTRGIQG